MSKLPTTRILLVLAITALAWAMPTASAWAYFPQIVRYTPSDPKIFPDQPINLGNSASVSFAVQNVGGGTLGDSYGDGSKLMPAAILGGAGASQFTLISDGCAGITLVRNATCGVTIVFNPDTIGQKSASLNISGAIWTLVGTGTNPVLGASSSALTFDPIGVSAGASAAKLVTVANNGSAGSTLTVTAAITGTDAAAFTRDAGAGTCAAPTSAPLAAGDSCTIAITFDPSHPLANTATLHLTDDVGGPAIDIPLSGVGNGPQLTLSTASYDFGGRNLGLPVSASTPITITNTGNAPLPLTSVGMTGGDASFNALSFDCTNFPAMGLKTLAAGASCVSYLNFAPTSLGSHTGTFQVAGSSQTAEAALSGTGTAPGFLAPTTSFAFGSQRIDQGASPAQSISIVNTGTGPLTISSTAITGTGASAFVMTASTCSAVIPALGSCTMQITFDPSELGDASATLHLVHDAAGSPSDIALSGTGIAAPTTTSPTTTSPTTTKPRVKHAPVVRGVHKVGKRLTCAGALWTGTRPLTLKYSWQRKVGRRWVTIRGATKSTYLLVRADAGKQIRCTMVARNAAGSATSSSTAIQITV